MLSAVDVHYGTAEPPVGHFLPDLTLRTPARDTVRARELFAAGRPVLFDLADDAVVRKTADGWAGRVDTVTAEPLDGPAEPLPARPDGYLAWAGAEGLVEALETWFGRPS
jgi:bifunctional hydroxylase/dehydrase